ncbi:2-epi-5-epi-valiolone synthase [Hoplias malabaricus]|uniref:2-epi-5-epi-valiolone synthase n=1 Tax=Hoplias malabaricus TaxID=27720 RepID=UPI003462C606
MSLSEEEQGLKSNNKTTTEYSLVKVKNTWSRRTGPQLSDGRRSDARISESSSGSGVSWTVVSPVVFTYRIVETENLLDVNNDTLLFGHIADPEEVRTLKQRPESLRRFVVIDETVQKLYGSQVIEYFESWGVTYQILSLPTTEENKSLNLVTEVLQEVHRFGVDRRSEPMIAIGGGVCLDVVGLAAALYRRRTPFIRVPTTTLSYIDASVGAKSGVNFCGGKNKLGSYTPPSAVFLDRSFFKTLPRRHIANGMAEMLKMALMKHKGLYELLETEGRGLLDSAFQSPNVADGHGIPDSACMATRVAIVTMLEELVPNLWEDDLDRLVDFGHVISPELEMTVLPELLHGEAVNIDMSFMLYVSQERGHLTDGEVQRVLSCMRSLDLPVWSGQCSLDLIQKSLQERFRHSGGALRMPLPTGLGTAEIFNDVDSATLKKAFEKWCEDLGSGRSDYCPNT